MSRQPVGVLEVFGLRPLGPALHQCWTALAGDEYAPPSRWGPSSLRILKPWISLPLWLGRTRADRRVVVYNLFNRSPAPVHEGYSVRVTHARDFRGRQLTYDGHVGTDLAVPVGTEVVAPAGGLVCDVRNDMQRGGLKVCIDHGAGLLTMCNHLARALVQPGQRVARGEVIALSGMSSVDGVLFSPWLAPHVHFNVVLNGEAVDPFADEGETPLWRTGDNSPRPHGGSEDKPIPPTRWSEQGVEGSIEACRDAGLREGLARSEPELRPGRVAVTRIIRPHVFTRFPELVVEPCPRTPLIDLPFGPDDATGVVLADER